MSSESTAGGGGVPFSYSVYFLNTVDDLAIGPASADSEEEAPLSPTLSIPSPGGGIGDSPHTPQGLGSTPNQIQWATPPTDGSADSEGASLWYRTIPNLLGLNTMGFVWLLQKNQCQLWRL